MKAALYVRVSTDEQAQEGFSISAQINLLTEYCSKNKINIYKIYADEGISGQKENRPQFQTMIRDAESKLFDIILVHKFDRFARRVELSQRVKQQLRKAGVNVVSITEPVEDSPIGFFTEGIMELLAEYYVRNLAQESKKGHIERAKTGLHNGSVPYGYKIDKETGFMVINEEQAKVVRLIFDMYVNKGYGSSKIANILNEAGIPTAVSGQWAHYTVNRILKNVKYIGKIYYDGHVYDGMHEPIIDEKTFNLVQKFMKERTWKGSYKGSNHRKFLFLGFLRCGECGKVFRIHSNYKSSSKRKDSLYYYVCNNATHNDAKNRCTFRKHFSTVKLECDIINELKDIMAGAKIENIKENKPDIDILSIRREKLQKELERAKQAYLSGVFELQEYSDIRNKLEKELEEINISEPNKLKLEEKMRKKIVSLWDKFESVKTIPEKKAILKEFIDCIYISRDGMHINFVL